MGKRKKDNEYELAILRAKHRGVLSNLSIQQQQQEQKCSDLEQMKGDINKDLDVYKSFLEIIKPKTLSPRNSNFSLLSLL